MTTKRSTPKTPQKAPKYKQKMLNSYKNRRFDGESSPMEVEIEAVA